MIMYCKKPDHGSGVKTGLQVKQASTNHSEVDQTDWLTILCQTVKQLKCSYTTDDLFSTKSHTAAFMKTHARNQTAVSTSIRLKSPHTMDDDKLHSN